jgi:hypothetical protein
VRLAAALVFVAALLAGCGGEEQADPPAAVPQRPLLSDRFLRSPHVKTDMDTNPANLASAVVTYGFGQLPMYIDAAEFRLLPFELEQATVPGQTLTTRYRLTVPRTHLVLDAVAATSPTAAETKRIAHNFRVKVSLDGRYVRDPNRFWVFYRNNGPQICRIYFPGDLGSLQMGANSMVWKPLPAGRHTLRVEVDQHIVPERPPGRIVRVYALNVLDREPTPAERAIAPDEEGPPPPNNRTPLTFRTQATS